MENENEKLQEIVEKLLESFTEEQKAKAAECETLDDLVKLAGDEGIELPEELLDDVAGGRLTFIALRNGLFGGIGGSIGIRPLFQKIPKPGVKTIFSTGNTVSAQNAIFDTSNKTVANDAVFRGTTTGTKNTVTPTGIIVGDMQKA